MKRLFVILLLTLAFAPAYSRAGEAESMIADPVIEARIKKLGEELRCLVCQGQSLADSHSDFAMDMKRKIQQLMEEGKSDKEVLDFLQARYGDFILYRPPLKSSTVLLWFGPLLLFAAGAGVLGYNLARRRKRIQPAPLSEEEQARVRMLLNEETGEPKA